MKNINKNELNGFSKGSFSLWHVFVLIDRNQSYSREKEDVYKPDVYRGYGRLYDGTNRNQQGTGVHCAGYYRSLYQKAPCGAIK